MNKPEEDPKTPSQSQHAKHQLTYMLHVLHTYTLRLKDVFWGQPLDVEGPSRFRGTYWPKLLRQGEMAPIEQKYQ